MVVLNICGLKEEKHNNICAYILALDTHYSYSDTYRNNKEVSE